MLHRVLQNIIWFLVWAIRLTQKFEIRGLEHREKVKSLNPKNAFVFAVWHEHVLSVLSAHAWTVPFLTLASRSKDGDYAAFVCKKFGFIPVRGSSRKKNKDKGGKEAIQEYIAKMGEGISGGITIDGPKGPRHGCKPGIVLIAKETQAPILPAIAEAKSVWEFNSWDRFKVPKPFATIVITYGEPIMVPKDATPEQVTEYCHLVEERLAALHNNFKF